MAPVRVLAEIGRGNPREDCWLNHPGVTMKNPLNDPWTIHGYSVWWKRWLLKWMVGDASMDDMQIYARGLDRYVWSFALFSQWSLKISTSLDRWTVQNWRTFPWINSVQAPPSGFCMFLLDDVWWHANLACMSSGSNIFVWQTSKHRASASLSFRGLGCLRPLCTLQSWCFGRWSSMAVAAGESLCQKPRMLWGRDICSEPGSIQWVRLFEITVRWWTLCKELYNDTLTYMLGRISGYRVLCF